MRGRGIPEGPKTSSVERSSAPFETSRRGRRATFGSMSLVRDRPQANAGTQPVPLLSKAVPKAHKALRYRRRRRGPLEGAALIMRSRHMLADGRLLQLLDAFYPADLFEGTEEAGYPYPRAKTRRRR